MRRDGSRVRIAAQLSQVSDQTQVWAESYERHLEDIFAIQTEVAESIARSLTIEFGLGRWTDGSETCCFPVSARARWRRAG